jgi:hypothetical protein
MGVQETETFYLENLDRNARNSNVGEAILYTIRIRVEDSSTRFKETYQLIITSITASNMIIALSTNKALVTTGAKNTLNGSDCIIQSVSSDREKKNGKGHTRRTARVLPKQAVAQHTAHSTKEVKKTLLFLLSQGDAVVGALAAGEVRVAAGVLFLGLRDDRGVAGAGGIGGCAGHLQSKDGGGDEGSDCELHIDAVV